MYLSFLLNFLFCIIVLISDRPYFNPRRNSFHAFRLEDQQFDIFPQIFSFFVFSFFFRFLFSFLWSFYFFVLAVSLIVPSCFFCVQIGSFSQHSYRWKYHWCKQYTALFCFSEIRSSFIWVWVFSKRWSCPWYYFFEKKYRVAEFSRRFDDDFRSSNIKPTWSSCGSGENPYFRNSGTRFDFVASECGSIFLLCNFYFTNISSASLFFFFLVLFFPHWHCLCFLMVFSFPPPEK